LEAPASQPASSIRGADLRRFVPDSPLEEAGFEIGCRDPRPRAEWRAMCLLALPAD